MKYKERSIILPDLMIQAILENRKSQIRVIVKPQPRLAGSTWYWSKRYKTGSVKLNTIQFKDDGKGSMLLAAECPYGQKGDRLRVKETWQTHPDDPDLFTFKANCEYAPSDNGWRSPAHMPKEFSRITLEIINVHIERLQKITFEDIKAEGIIIPRPILGVDITGEPIESRYVDKDPWWFFAEYWDFHNKKCGFDWDTNPTVFVIDHKQVERI